MNAQNNNRDVMNSAWNKVKIDAPQDYQNTWREATAFFGSTFGETLEATRTLNQIVPLIVELHMGNILDAMSVMKDEYDALHDISKADGTLTFDEAKEHLDTMKTALTDLIYTVKQITLETKQNNN
jgi:methyl-accepting chemotaxis protein